MTEWQHRDVARGRWHGLSLAEQFGKVGRCRPRDPGVDEES
jgi:hypothetical protein